MRVVLIVLAAATATACGSASQTAERKAISAAMPPSPTSTPSAALKALDQLPRCRARQLTMNFRYEGAGTQHSYGAVRIMNTGLDRCVIDRALTVRVYGSDTHPRVVSRPYQPVHGLLAIPPRAVVWASTDTVSDDLLHPRRCRTAKRITVQIDHARHQYSIPEGSLHGKSRMIEHLCHVGMHTGAVQLRQP